jgi:sterol desaturase/sphingolipid hydroxylase (fatty acid hydroxylase superfamily)
MEALHESILFIVTTPLFVIFIAAEIIVSNMHRNHRYSKIGFYENMYLMVVNTALDLGMRVLGLAFLLMIFESRFFEIENAYAYWILLFLFEDLTFYTIHYVDHYVRFFWAVHVTHHSSEEFNLTVGLRSSLFEPVYRFIYFIPMVMMGFKPVDVFFAYSVTQLYGVFIHTQYVGRLGFMEKFMATPSHHRVHHGSNPQYLDKNLGMFLIIWDKLFGTFEEEKEEVKYGLTKNLESHHPKHVIFHEFKSMIDDVRNAPDLRSKFMYIFGPPGWSHDGKRKTSKMMKQEWALRHAQDDKSDYANEKIRELAE